NIVRLGSGDWVGMSVDGLWIVGKLSNHIVYARWAAGSIKGLERRNPMDEKGHRKARPHQWLTEDVGHRALAQHLHAATALMRISKSWPQFKEMLDQAFPRRGDTLQLPLMYDDASSSWTSSSG